MITKELGKERKREEKRKPVPTIQKSRGFMYKFAMTEAIGLSSELRGGGGESKDFGYFLSSMGKCSKGF